MRIKAKKVETEEFKPLKWPPIFPLNKGLIVWYTFDDRSGAVLRDRSGKRNHGTISGATWVAGKRGSALRFNGTTNYVGTAVDLFSQATFAKGGSVSVLFKLLSLQSGLRRIVDIEGRFLCLEKVSSHRLNVYMYDGADRNAPTDALSAEANVWYHMIGTWDGTTMRCYIDGVLQTATVTCSVGTIDDVSRSMCIGGYNNVSLFANAVITRVLIYNRALNAAEAKRLAKSELMLVRH